MSGRRNIRSVVLFIGTCCFGLNQTIPADAVVAEMPRQAGRYQQHYGQVCEEDDKEARNA